MFVDYVYDTAKVHDSKHIDQLADSAYMDKERKQRLENDGVLCGIIQRRVRGQDELTAAQKQHNKQCAKVLAIVEHPFAWLKNTGGFLRVRYRGLQRNAIDFALAAIAYNFKRSLSLRA